MYPANTLIVISHMLLPLTSMAGRISWLTVNATLLLYSMPSTTDLDPKYGSYTALSSSSL